MQALKALVIFMGILIVIGIIVVGVTIYRRATDMAGSDQAGSDKAASSAPAPWTSGQTAPAQPGAQGGPAGSAPSTGGLAAQDGASAALSLKNAAPMSFGSRDLELPPGSEILSVQTVSLQPGVERVLVYARLPDGSSRILVLDPLRGNVGGEWRVPGPPDSGAAPRP